MKQARILKIVVASPSDVQAERDMIPAIVDELNKGIADERGVRLEVYRWETDAYPGFHPLGPQGQIDSCLRIEDCDLLIGILWKRFGTPVLDAQSGTEHEIRFALETCQKMGRPQLMIYFNQAPHESQTQAEKNQWQQVLDFKQALSQKVLWWEYNGRDQFRDFVRQHLTQFIRGDYSGRPLEDLLQAYRDHLTRRVGTVRIFGEAETRPMEKVFVELTLTEEYERPTINAQWLGMMDAELCRRRDIFARDDEDDEEKRQKEKREKVKRTLKPDELLRKRTQAVIVGAPGCGKTTLLRYLALKTMQADKRFPVFLELKSLSEKAFEAAEGNWVELLFAKAVVAPHSLSAAEAERCKAHFLTRLKAGEVTIFLDGLDEVAGAKFFSALCRSVNEFMASAYRHNDLIISTRPYALQHRFEGMQEMEIASLSPRQIEAFLQHYYGDDPTTKSLQQELRRRRELREMARIPFLLSVIAYLYRQQGEIVGERLELYRQLVQQLVTQLDREKNVERFYLPDPDGSLKRDFFKQLAYERLFVDEVEKDAERLILTGEVIAAKARMFCQTHHVANPHLLTADVKATPLLREIGADAYAFSHLTLQEYLAAVTIAEQPDYEKIFCRAYFNPTLAEMEVLPMTLGLVHKPDDFYTALEGLPESLNFANLRLRARGLAYVHPLKEVFLTKLTERLKEFISYSIYQERPYRDVVFSSFRTANRKLLDYISHHVASLLCNEDSYVRRHAAGALGRIGSAHDVDALIVALKDEDSTVRTWAASAIVEIGGERSVDALMAALKDEDSSVRWRAAEALGQIASEHSVDALIIALKDEDGEVRQSAAYALGQIGSERGVNALLAVVKDKDRNVRRGAALALGKIGNECSLDVLIAALKDEDWDVGRGAAEALGQIGSERSVNALKAALQDNNLHELHSAVVAALKEIGDENSIDALIVALKDGYSFLFLDAVKALEEIGIDRSINKLMAALQNEDRDIRQSAAKTLGKIGDERCIDALMAALKDKDTDMRTVVAKALGQIGNQRSVNALLTTLKDEDWYMRDCVVSALGNIGGERSVGALIAALKDESCNVRGTAAFWLGNIGSERGVDALIATLKDESAYVRMYAASALGYISNEASVDTLVETLKNDENFEVRQRAASSLGEIGSKRSVDALLTALKDEDWNLGSRVVDALGKIGSERSIGALIAALQNKDRDMRQSAAKALGEIGSELCVDALIIALKDEDGVVRNFAVEALGQIRSGRCIDALIGALKNNYSGTRWDAAKVLGTIGGERGVDALIAALKDKDANVRGIAADGLGQIGNERGVDALIATFGDENSGVSDSAAKALGRMTDLTLINGLIHSLSYNESFVRQKSAQVVGYYTTDKQVLATLQHLATNDPAEEVRTAAREAAEKYANKLRYFGE